MNVVFHAINGVGLGHLVRAICLATEVRALVPEARLLVLTNARDTTLLREAKLDFVRLPPRLLEPHADPKRALEALPEPVEDAALAAALDAFAPDLVVFDTHAPLRLAEHATRLGARTALVLRELRPEALRAFAASRAALAFDRIVVPHEPGEMDLAPLAGLPVTVVGPVVRALPRRGARRGSSRPDVVAIAGGGGQPVDARRYVRAVADAHALARLTVPDLVTTLVTGPYGEAPPNAGAYPGLTVVRAAKDLPRLLARASLVVSQAGYNAVAELRLLAKPAVLVPAYRKAEDQRERARRLERAGAAVIARPEARAIASHVERLLRAPDELAAMARAHEAIPLAPRNRAAAAALVATVPGALRRRLARAVIVAHDFAPKLGGMETVARALARSLLDGGVDVRVYTTSRLGARVASGLGPGVVEPLYRPRPRPLRIDLFADLLATIDAALAFDPDIVHLCHAGLGPWVSALKAALPARVTVNVHGNDLLAPWVHHGRDPAEYRAAQIAGLSAADAVIAVSRFSADLARSLAVDPARVCTIENGVDPRRFRPEAEPGDDAIAARLGIEPDDEVVLTVSRLAPRKGHRTALHAIAELARRRPRLRYVFTGASEVMRAELRALASELGIASRVLGVGFVPDGDLPALYRRARVFALLAESAAEDDVEGFGVALLEAAACGVPAVASRTGGVPEALVDGEMGFLVPPADPRAAARAIERLLADGELARACGERGRARAAGTMSDAHAAARVRETWERVLARDPEPVALSPWVAAAYEEANSGPSLARLAQRDARRRREERAARRETFARIAAKGGPLRVRATGDGARLLPEALDDCAALGLRPAIEVKLGRFLEDEFQRYALPAVETVDLVHGVPHRDARTIASQLAALATTTKIGAVRLYLTPEARADARLAVDAVPEAHALRRFFGARGHVVVPPPELMRYLSEVPAGGPETGMIEPTNLCNLECPTCPTGTGKIPPLPAMPLARFERVLGELAPRLRNLALWNYGEPLLNRDLPAMIAHAKRAGVKVVKVSSNVHFLDGARGEALLESGLDVLILSVDGASQETYGQFRKVGDFAKVAASVAWLCAEKKRRGLAKPRIELQFIVMRHNEHELPEMRRLAREWGVDALRVKTVGAEDDDTKHLVPTSRLLSRYKADGATPNVRHALCTMPWDHTVVNVDGSVTPCCYLRPDMGERFVMGNVFERPFTEIWRGEKYRAFRQAMLEGRESLPVCNRCRGGTHDLVAAVEEVSP